MGIWSGLGINYGHKGGAFDSTKQNDLNYLWDIGFRKLRIAYPTYNRSTTNVNSRNLVEAALKKGFYVVWGTTATGGVAGDVTATVWADYKDYFLTVICPWAQALNNPNLQLSIGNEEELHVDGSTLTTSTLITDLSGSFSSAVQAAYTRGNVCYDTSALWRPQWATNTKGNLDNVGFNVYYEDDPNATFKSSVNNIATVTFTGSYISEWNTSSGFNNAIGKSPNAETWWADNLSQRLAILKNAGRDAYLFSFEDGGFGVPANTFAMRTTTGEFRVVWQNILGKRLWML